MGYNVRVSVHDRYLRIEASGSRDVEASRELFRRIAEESARHELYDILLVLKLEGRLSTFEIQDVVESYKEAGLDARHRIAAVDENEESAPDLRFAEDIATVRGLKGAVFDREQDAVHWLREG